MTDTLKLGTATKAISTLRLFTWDEIDNELREAASFPSEQAEHPEWNVVNFTADGVMKLRTDRHTAFYVWAGTIERAHETLLQHKEYCETNETEA